MKHFNGVVRRNTASLIKNVVYHRLENKKKKTKKINLSLREFFDKILHRFNEELKNQEYLTGENISTIDVQVHIEIFTILSMFQM